MKVLPEHQEQLGDLVKRPIPAADYARLIAAYEAEKAKWAKQHPWATPEQYEQALRRIAERLGL